MDECTAEDPISPRVTSYVEAVACEHFGSSFEEVRIKLLAGGYSNAANVYLEIAGTPYVFRVTSEQDSPTKRNAELFAMREAAAAEAAPTIRWISADGHGILMDYIPGGTLSIEQARQPEFIVHFAHLLRKVHALPINPYWAPSFKSQMEEFYWLYSHTDSKRSIWDDAIAIIREGALQLQNLNAPMVNTHGDLNPRNILVSDQGIYVIDWGDGMYTDPFHDLGFFSIMMDYNSTQEAFLLECYLGHLPTVDESERFRIAKRMNFARLTLSGQDIGNLLSADQNGDSTVLGPLREWSYYARTFADGKTALTAQFFWGQAQVALDCAKAL